MGMLELTGDTILGDEQTSYPFVIRSNGPPVMIRSVLDSEGFMSLYKVRGFFTLTRFEEINMDNAIENC